MRKKKLEKFLLLLAVAVAPLVFTLLDLALAKSVYLAADYHTHSAHAWFSPSETLSTAESAPVLATEEPSRSSPSEPDLMLAMTAASDEKDAEIAAQLIDHTDASLDLAKNRIEKFFASGSDSACGVDWQAANPVPEEIIIVNSVTYDDGQFVATAGYPGGFLTSPDGLNWTWHTLSGTQIYEDITWGGNQYVAVKGQPYLGPAIRISPDGVTWTGHDSGIPSGLDLYGVTWNGSRYVAVGGVDAVSLIANSPDGVNWTWETRPGGELRSVAWSGSQFVAVGKSPYIPGYLIPAPILTSPDGVTWTERHSDTTTTQDLYDVTWGGNQFVAIGAGSIAGTGIQAVILTSPDGVTWTEQHSGTTNDLKSVIWNGNQFVAVGLYGTILTSPDGVTWTAAASGTTAGLYGVTWGMNRFVAVGGAAATILVSLCDAEPDVTPLSNAQPRTISVNLEQDVYYSLDVPSGASNLSFLLDDLTADLDLYVKYGSLPTLSNYDCVSYNYGTASEECTFSSPQTGTYYVMVHGYEAGSSSLTGSYSSSCTFTISPSSKNFTSAGGSQVVTVTASSSSCAWTASENLDWVTLSSTGGTGSGSVTVSASANTGAARNGTVSIAEKTFSVSQQAISGYNRNKSMPWLLLLLE